MQSILVEFSYLTPEIRGEFLGVLQTFVDETIVKKFDIFPMHPQSKQRVKIGDIWVQSQKLVLVEFQCESPQVREAFLRELKTYVDDGIAPDLPYDDKVVDYVGFYVHIKE